MMEHPIDRKKRLRGVNTSAPIRDIRDRIADWLMKEMVGVDEAFDYLPDLHRHVFGTKPSKTGLDRLKSGLKGMRKHSPHLRHP